MKTINKTEMFELDIQIEELELKVAPDGGETVLPLPHLSSMVRHG